MALDPPPQDRPVHWHQDVARDGKNKFGTLSSWDFASPSRLSSRASPAWSSSRVCSRVLPPGRKRGGHAGAAHAADLPVTVVLLHHGLFGMAGAFAWVEKTGRLRLSPDIVCSRGAHGALDSGGPFASWRSTSSCSPR